MLPAAVSLGVYRRSSSNRGQRDLISETTKRNNTTKSLLEGEIQKCLKRLERERNTQRVYKAAVKKS